MFCRILPKMEKRCIHQHLVACWWYKAGFLPKDGFERHNGHRLIKKTSNEDK